MNLDQQSDEQEYEEEILAEAVELEAECEEDYQRKLAEYKKQLEEWKIWRRKQVEIGIRFWIVYLERHRQTLTRVYYIVQKSKKRKRKKKKKGQAQEDTEEEDEDQEVSKSEGLVEEGPPKPEPPEKPDFDSIEQRVREKASRIRRKPGESILIPELSASGNITASELCPRYEEKLR